MQTRARELLGFEGSHQRYVDVNSVRDLEDISDPHTLEDETQRTWREWLSDNKITGVAFGMLGLVGMIVVLLFAREFIPLIIGNVWVQRGVVLVGVYIWGRRNGWRANQSRIEDIDEANLQYESGNQKTVKGVILDRDETTRFIPFKGYRTPGMKPQPYTAAEIDPSILERADGRVDPSLPAIIRMDEDFVSIQDTESGGRLVQLTSGLVPDPESGGKETGLTVLKAAPPETAPPEKVREITETNMQLAEDKKRLKKESRQKDQTIDRLRDEKNRPVDERHDELIDKHQRLRPDGRRRTDNSKNGRTASSGVDETVERVHEEVSSDD